MARSAFYHRIIRRNGDVRHIYSETTFEFDKNGKPVGLFGIAHDVTDFKLAESALLKTEMSYKNLLDNMHDGFMVDDIFGKVTFANDRYCEIFGIKKCDLNKIMLEDYVAPEYRSKLRNRHDSRVAGERVPDDFEYQGLRQDGTKIWLEVHVKPIVENGIVTGTQSVINDITERKRVEEKIAYANRLYAFISQINQAIVHINNEESLFKEACRIAVEFGKFKMAWIGIIDPATLKIDLVEQHGIPNEDIELYTRNYDRGAPQYMILGTNNYYVCNDVQRDFGLHSWKPYAASRGIAACMVLPLRRSGSVIGTMNIYASEADFFNEVEIRLLEEIAGDISFALDAYEKEKLRMQAEAKLKKAFNDIQTLLDHTGEMFITVGKDMGIVSFNKNAKEGCKKFLGKDLIPGTSILEYTSSDRVELLRTLYTEVLSGKKRQTESVFEVAGEKIHFLTLMKPIFNVSGEIEGVFVIEQNISEHVKNSKRIEFDQYNLNALINNTKNLMWSVDKNYNLITANSAFREVVKQMAGIDIKKGDSALAAGFDEEQLAKFKRYYDQAFAGQSFTEIEYNPPPYESWSEISFYPIMQGNIAIGTACYAHDITPNKLAEIKLLQANRMYAFTSQINQTIVHITDEQALFSEACRIAVSVGEFELACIGRLDEVNRKLDVVTQNNADPANLEQYSSLEYSENGAIAKILLDDKSYIINDYSMESEQDFWHQCALSRELKSAIILPVKKLGKTCYIFSLFSKKANIFNNEEVALLEEAAGDISFALDVFEKERERKLFQDKLIHNELRLKQAQAIANFGNWELDFSSGKAIWSEEACRIYGLDPGDNIQSYQSWVSFIHPDDLDYVMKLTNEGRETLNNTTIQHRIIRVDGAVRHIVSQSHFEFDREGKPVGMYGVAHDITDIKEAEDAIRQSKNNLRLIVDMIPQAIFAMNSKGEFVFVNKSFAELFGCTPKQLVHKTVYDTLPDKNASPEFIAQSLEVIDTGRSMVTPEVIFTTYSGEVKTFYSTKVPFAPAGKEEKAMLGISLDITEQKKADSERVKMMADIVQRNKDLEQFSYIVSHNLRSPLANIMGLSDLLQIVECDADEEKLMMQNLFLSVKKLDMVIKDLNYVLQVKHQVNEKKELIRFSELCGDIQLSIFNLLRSEDVHVITDFSAVDEMHTLKSYLYSVFFNLISNSIKYRRPGVSPIIEITSWKEANTIGLVFKDNGLGIDLEKRGSQVFGLYKRFHDHTEGKGMGLYMVKTQVETLGGKITIESAVNIGTTFKIIFENN